MKTTSSNYHSTHTAAAATARCICWDWNALNRTTTYFPVYAMHRSAPECLESGKCISVATIDTALGELRAAFEAEAQVDARRQTWGRANKHVGWMLMQKRMSLARCSPDVDVPTAYR